MNASNYTQNYRPPFAPNGPDNNPNNENRGNNKNNPNKENNKNSKYYDFAVYPNLVDDEIIEQINEKIAPRENNKIKKSNKQNKKLPYFRISCPKFLEKNLLSLTGTQISDRPYYFGPVSNDEEKLVTEMDQKFDLDILEGQCLNLSSLPDKFSVPDPPDPFLASYLLYLAAIKSISAGAQITEINCEDNGLTNTIPFNNICLLFPNLEKVFLAGNPLKNDRKLLDPFTPPDESDRQPVEVIINERYTQTFVVPKPFQLSLRKVIKGKRIVSSRPKFNLSNFIPAKINPNESPIHRFILAFLDRGWSDLKNIHEFYIENAVFSVTVDVCLSKSPLAANFVKTGINRDFLANSPGRLAVGPKQIAEMQFEIFGGGFYANLISYAISIISDQMSGVVCHGAFQKNTEENGSIFCFDRSFFIGFYDDHMFITNDHIFIREAKLPGMI